MNRNTSLWVIIVLGALTAVTPLATDMYLPSMPKMTVALQATASEIQLTLGIMTLGVGIGQLVAGPLGDCYGRKRPIIIGSILCTLASLLCAFATSIEMLLLGRFLQGFTGSIGVVLAKAIARDLVKGPALTQLFASLMMVNGLAPVVAPLIGGQIVVYGTWRTVFHVLTGLCFILLLMACTLRETLPIAERQPSVWASMHNYIDLCKDPFFIGQSMIQFFAFGSFFAYISGSSFVFQNVYGLSPQWFSYLFGINSCGIILAGYITAHASKIASPYQQLSFSLWQLTICSIIFLLCMVWHAPLWMTAIILFFAVATVAIFGAAGFSLAMENYGHMAGSASAVLGALSMIAAAVVSPIVGLGGTHTGVPMGIVMTVLGILSLVCLYTYGKKK